MKKYGMCCLSFLLVVVMIVGLLPVASTTSAEPFSVTTTEVGYYGSNSKFLTHIGSPDPDAIQIYTAQDLDNIRKDLTGSYVLMNDIDLTGYKDGLWEPIGNNSMNISGTSRFRGIFDGQGHVIRNLTITGDVYQYAGLFGYAEVAVIKNVGLEDIHINIACPSNLKDNTDSSYAGGICGFIIGVSLISNCYNTGNVASASSFDGYYDYHNSSAGGICGFSNSPISYCYNTGDISSFASSTSSFGSYAGGICGSSNTSNSITSCYNTGDISSYSKTIGSSTFTSQAGGICGSIRNGSISNCFNIGDVSSFSYSLVSYAGGICGNSYYSSPISNCYNKGDVFSSSSTIFTYYSYAGGICGYSYSNNISDCVVLSQRIYAENRGTMANIYRYLIGYGINKTNNLALEGILGNATDDSDGRITLEQAKRQDTYESLGWDFANIWQMVPGYNYPQLRGLPHSGPSGVSVSGRIKSYNPDNPIFIQLYKQHSDDVYTTTIDSDAGYGQVEQEFRFEGVVPGIYDLVIAKDVHTKFTVKNVFVDDEDLDLTLDKRPEVQLMTLRCGDISNDGLINDADLTILWRAGNYNKKAVEAENSRCDLNGDGLINDADLTILWLAYNYNRGAIIID